jgi:phage shock protein A
MVEKEYGEAYIKPAMEFIERIDAKVAEIMGYKETDVEESGLQYYTGKKKYGKDGMAKLAQAGRDGASEEELGRIKDKYKKESQDILKLAGLN